MEFEVKAQVRIEEGKYSGVVSRVEYRDEPFKYTDIYVKLDGQDVELKVGYPSTVSEASGLGRVLKMFGASLKVGEKIDPAKAFIGKPCQFLVVLEKNEDGEFARIVKESFKPKPKPTKEEDAAEAYL